MMRGLDAGRVGAVEFPLAGDQGEEGEGDVFGGEDFAEEFAVGGGVEGEGGLGGDDMDVVEVPGAGTARSADGSVLFQLLANGAEFPDGNHGGGIDEDRERIHFGHAAGRSVFVFAEVDRKGFELIGANDGCLAAQLLEVGVEELVAGFVDQLEFEPVATPPGEGGVVPAGGFRRKADVEGDEAEGAKRLARARSMRASMLGMSSKSLAREKSRSRELREPRPWTRAIALPPLRTSWS